MKTEIAGDDFKFAAADGFRLAVYSGKLAEPPSEDIEFLIPARVLNEISRLLGTQQKSVEFMVTPSSNQALFRVEDVEIVSSLIAGNFPNYNQLIPQSSHHSGGIELGRIPARHSDGRHIRARR